MMTTSAPSNPLMSTKAAYAVLFGLVFALSMLIFSTAEPAYLIAGSVVAFIVGALLLLDPPLFCALAGVTYAFVQGAAEEVTLLSLAGQSLNGSQAFGVVVTALILARCLLHFALRPADLRIPKESIPLLVFLVSAFGATLYGPAPASATIPSLFRIIACTTAFFFAYWTAKNWRVVNVYLMTSAVAATVVTGSTALEAFVFRGGAASTIGYRAEGSIGTSQTGGVALLGLAVFVYLLNRKDRRATPLLLAGLMIVGIGMFGAFVRAALLGSAFFIISEVLFSQRRMRDQSSFARRVLTMIFIVVALGSGLLLVDEATMEERLDDVPGIGGLQSADPDAGSGRVRIWSGVLAAMKDNDAMGWIIGNGLHSSQTATLREIGSYSAAHNSFLEVLFNQGLVGLSAYVLIAVFLLRALVSATRLQGDAGLLGNTLFRFFCCYLASIACFGSSVYTMAYRWYIFLLIGALLGYAASHRSEARATDSVADLSARPSPDGTVADRGAA